MRTPLTAAAAAALIASLASPAVAASNPEAGYAVVERCRNGRSNGNQDQRDATAPLTCRRTAAAAASGPRNPWPRSPTR